MDHNIIVSKNSDYDDVLNYSSDYKFTDSYKLLLLRKSSRMVKYNEKNKKMCEQLPLIDDTTLKEMQMFMHEPSENVANLVIQNNNDFKLKTKEKTNKIQMNNNNFKGIPSHQSNNIQYLRKDDDCDYNKTIEIKCTNKILEHTIVDTVQCNKNVKADQENKKKFQDHLPPSPPINNVKDDLKSILIMMAISNEGHTKYDMRENRIKYDEHVFPGTAKNEKEDQNIQMICLVKHDQCEDMSDVLKVTPMNVANDAKRSLLRKYGNKWLDYVKKQRENANQKHRQEIINNFFDKLEKRKVEINQSSESICKSKVHVRDYNTYQHRYKMQKHIIALQKAKLEQQNRLIEELKYNKIIDASRQSVDNMKEDIRQSYYEIDKYLKPKIKCLTNELKIREIDEPSLVLHCLKVPQFLKRMEERAREREEKHAMIRERRKQMEEERIKLKQQAELAKAEMDKEEKMQIMKELRQKRRKEKIDNIRKKQYAERTRALFVMAELHYERSLLTKFGLRPFKLLMKIKQDNIEKAKTHYQFQIQKNVFLNWMWYAEDMWYERNFKAENFYRKKILKKTFDCIKMNHNEFLLKMQVAEDYYDLYVTELVFQKFREGIDVLKLENENKLQNAVKYYDSNLLFKTFSCWRSLPALNALKREQDVRKLRWREKVLQVVPDYTPPED